MHSFSFFVFIRTTPTTPERIVYSYRHAQTFITENLPGYEIKEVARDGFCIISAFKEGLSSIGKEQSFEDIIITLKNRAEQQKGILSTILRIKCRPFGRTRQIPY